MLLCHNLLHELNRPKSFDPEEQKRSLISIFERMTNLKLNTVVLQVRARGDLLYPSQIEPWATSLTGALGKSPGYDPLKFAIEEAHKLGLEFHAVRPWANRDRRWRWSGVMISTQSISTSCDTRALNSTTKKHTSGTEAECQRMSGVEKTSTTLRISPERKACKRTRSSLRMLDGGWRKASRITS